METAASLGAAARAGDWPRVELLVTSLSQATLPSECRALGEYLAALQEALVAGKISRSHLAATLYRLHAASAFNGAAISLPGERQYFAESPGS